MSKWQTTLYDSDMSRFATSPKWTSPWIATLALSISVFALSTAAIAQETRHLTLDLELQPWTGDLDGMMKRRIVRVLAPYSKTLYFVDFGGRQRGMSYDFMLAFERYLNKKYKLHNLSLHIVMIPVPRDQLFPALLAGQGDIAAANLTITADRQSQVDFTLPLARNVRELIVTGPSTPPLNALDDLAGKEIFVQPASSYYQSLLTLNQQFLQRKLPPMKLWNAPGHFESEDILEMANAGLVNIVVADAYIANLWKQVFKRIRVHDNLVLRDAGDIAFAVRKGSPKFLADFNEFAKAHRQGTEFGNVTLQKYLEQTHWVKGATSPAELKRFNTLVTLFQKYGAKYQVDWLLMAAQAYQESQLDHSRKSPVGAIGIMQIMPATGKQMQVGDITQLEPNIHAGVKYIRHLIDVYFNDPAIDDLNRTLFAFAAYNAGPSRVRALRREALQRKLNPNVWFDNVERVAAQRIGRETVQYVSNIYKYYFAYTLIQPSVKQELNRRDALKPIAFNLSDEQYSRLIYSAGL
jgi:membrane-bound lytic murein transglycosylase MltF